MFKLKSELRYYLYALSNFLAAFGGGMILGKGIGILDLPFIKGGSILAFLLGCVLGIIFLQLVPKKWSNSIARCFSICCGITSIILLYIFQSHAENGKLNGVSGLIFFAFLSIRFGFWFYSRVLRASASAGQEQQIAWVELGYFLGVILGLIFWSWSNIVISLALALIVDVCLQLTAGFVDIIANRIPKPAAAVQNKNEIKFNYLLSDQKNWLWRLAISTVLLIMGVQVILFHLSHQVSEVLGTNILAIFYLGLSIAALVCKKFKIQLDWVNYIKDHRYAVLTYTTKQTKEISFLLVNIISAVSIAIAVIVIYGWKFFEIPSSNPIFYHLNIENIIILSFVGVGSFFYGILDLAILDRIGLEEQHSQSQGMIIRTYGMMAIGAAVCMWGLGVMDSAMNGLLVMLCICFLLTIGITQKRKMMRVER